MKGFDEVVIRSLVFLVDDGDGLLGQRGVDFLDSFDKPNAFLDFCFTRRAVHLGRGLHDEGVWGLGQSYESRGN